MIADRVDRLATLADEVAAQRHGSGWERVQVLVEGTVATVSLSEERAPGSETDGSAI